MGSDPRRPKPPRRDRLIQESRHDPYVAEKKRGGPALCPDCGATYQAGRWTWRTDSLAVPGVPCPACQRIRDDLPAGILTLRGEFLEAHRDEIVGLLRNLEEGEKAEHPLKRIMRLDERPGETTVSTTDLHLARLLGDAVHHAYDGDLEFGYEKGGDLLRVEWKR